MSQQSMFNTEISNEPDMPLKMYYRVNDPETSKVAASKADIKGQAKLVFEHLRRFQPCDPKTLSQKSRLPYHLIQRRISELRRRGLIEATGKVIDGCTEYKVVDND